MQSVYTCHGRMKIDVLDKRGGGGRGDRPPVFTYFFDRRSFDCLFLRTTLPLFSSDWVERELLRLFVVTEKKLINRPREGIDRRRRTLGRTFKTNVSSDLKWQGRGNHAISQHRFESSFNNPCSPSLNRSWPQNEKCSVPPRGGD